MLLGDLAKRAELIKAGVGKHDIYMPSFSLHHLIKSLDITKVGRVRPNRCHVGANIGNSLVHFPLAPPSNENLSPFLDESLRGPETDASTAAGYNCDFAIKFACQRVAPPCRSRVAVPGYWR